MNKRFFLSLMMSVLACCVASPFLAAGVADVAALLPLRDDAYIAARDAFLQTPGASADINDFQPTDLRGRWLKRTLRGWIDHQAKYAALRPRMLEIESMDLEANKYRWIREDATPPNEVIVVRPDAVLMAPRALELTLFEQNGLVRTGVRPNVQAHGRWRVGALWGEIVVTFVGDTRTSTDPEILSMHADVLEAAIEYNKTAAIPGAIGIAVSYRLGDAATLATLEQLAQDQSIPQPNREAFSVAVQVLRDRLVREGVIPASAAQASPSSDPPKDGQAPADGSSGAAPNSGGSATNPGDSNDAPPAKPKEPDSQPNTGRSGRTDKGDKPGEEKKK